MILDLIARVKIPEDIEMELESAIIEAWRLKIPGSTKEKRSGEINHIFQFIEKLRTSIDWLRAHHYTYSGRLIDSVLLHSLSMGGSGLEPQEIKKFKPS